MPDLHYEKLHGFYDGKIICGVDEVGRGPLAGPVIAAALILPPEGLPQDIESRIRDSKKLSEKQRERLFPALTGLCCHAVAEASVAEIDAINILRASLLAMQRAVEGLGVQVDQALIDGNQMPKLACPALTIVKGDSKSLSIAAASIVAKVFRDRLMKKLAEQHPGYGWEKNAGYGTAQHLIALRELGVTCWHRTSFAPVAHCGHPGSRHGLSPSPWGGVRGGVRQGIRSAQVRDSKS
ncbi:MAG: ribonuclease HII [Alphaproteobacteria bacterium]|nr:ribonuclease HII [Alphaproteobacteria bacterium]